MGLLPHSRWSPGNPCFVGEYAAALEPLSLVWFAVMFGQRTARGLSQTLLLQKDLGASSLAFTVPDGDLCFISSLLWETAGSGSAPLSEKKKRQKATRTVIEFLSKRRGEVGRKVTSVRYLRAQP